MDGVRIIKTEGLRDLAADVIDEHGQPRVMPASYYVGTTQDERSMLCVRHGLYLLPTSELVHALGQLLGSVRAIEIGAGNGVLAKALGIPATDNRMQERPHLAQLYNNMGQAPVRYGDNVETLDAHDAIAKYKPEVILGCWVTHRWRADAHERGGNMYAPDEREVLDSCAALILILNEETHRSHPLIEQPHKRYAPPWLYSRARSPANFIGIWRGSKV